jgi:hypothetical protein
MTTLDRIPQPAPIPPALVKLPEEGRLGPAGAPSAPATAPPGEILPALVETPAWPRVFPSL